MVTNPGVNKLSLVRGYELQLDTLITGLGTLSQTSSFNVSGTMETRDTLIQAFTQDLVPYQNVRSGRIEVQQSLAERNENQPASKKRFAAVRAAIIGALGVDNPDLAKFGFKPKKKAAKPTVDELVERVSRNQSTRKKRGTLGPKQKEAIHGEATPLVPPPPVPPPPAH